VAEGGKSEVSKASNKSTSKEKGGSDTTVGMVEKFCRRRLLKA
jgi:hypothetical protein